MLDRERLDGSHGTGVQLAMSVVRDLALAMQAEELVDIESAHVDGCFYVGDASIDFVRALTEGGAEVAVPTTLNVGSVDLLNNRLQPLVGAGERAAELMNLYTRLGASPTWTCTPYQVQHRPQLGTHVAWGESNAIAYANSVLGARTERYGDFVDVAAAITGRAPYAGLHRTENRHAELEFDVSGLAPRWFEEGLAFALLGLVVGARSEGRIPVVTGVGHATEDDLKAFGAAAASSGSCALFHVVGLTPEAPTLSVATGGRDVERVGVTDADLDEAWRQVVSATDVETDGLRFVCLGTPHFSRSEFEELALLLAGRRVAPGVRLVVSTSRQTLAEVTSAGTVAELTTSGVEVIVDTCTYNSRVLGPMHGIAMTNSAKWAWYAPMNVGATVVMAGLGTCVEAAVSGEVPRVVR